MSDARYDAERVGEGAAGATPCWARRRDAAAEAVELAADGRRCVKRRLTIVCRLLRSTCGRHEGRARSAAGRSTTDGNGESGRAGTHHDLDKVERAHADRDVGVVGALEDRVEVGRDEVRVRRGDLDERDEGNVPHCERSSSASTLSEHQDYAREEGRTVLVDVLEEAAELLDAGPCEALALDAGEHAADDRRLDALVQERHGGRRLDELGERREELLDEARLFRREDGELRGDDESALRAHPVRDQRRKHAQA